MLRFILRRLLQMAGVVVVLSLLLFLWLRSLPGGTVSAILGERATAESRARLEAAFGLDQPIWVQYGRFVGRVLTGDFGTSFQNSVAVGPELLNRIPVTLELAVLAFLVARYCCVMSACIRLAISSVDEANSRISCICSRKRRMPSSAHC